MDQTPNTAFESERNIKNAFKASSGLGFILTGLLILYYIMVFSVGHYFRYFLDINLKETPFRYVLNYVPIYGIGLLLVLLLSKKIPAAKASGCNFPIKRLFIITITAYGLGTITNMVATTINAAISSNYNSSLEIMEMVSNNPFLSFLVIVIIAPIAEELIFRKVIVDRLVLFSEKYAILVSAVCFGLYHRNLQQMFYATVIGAIFAYTYSRSGKIIYTMIMHAIFNGLGFIASLLSAKVYPVMSELASGQFDTSKLLEIAPFYLALILVSQVLMVCAVMSVIFLFRKGTKIRFNTNAAYQLPKGKEFPAMFLNPGMIVLAVICIAIMILQIIGIL